MSCDAWSVSSHVLNKFGLIRAGLRTLCRSYLAGSLRCRRGAGAGGEGCIK